MIIKILLGLAILVAALAVFIATRPSDFRITRSAVLPAPPSVVFPQVNDLHKWEAWSPWAKLDPNSKTTFDGPPAGTGSSMAWAGNEQVGEGKMTITESKLNELILMRLEFIKPFQATNATEFTFKPEGSGTLVTWTMSGQNNFVGKAIGLFMNCEKMLGGQFEQGLDNLKKVVSTGQN
ncbi:MAG TPA: SRPBCC family protein [Chthoniobacterales bacterium]